MNTLRLIAYATVVDRFWIPQVDQVQIFLNGLLHICGLNEPDNSLDKKVTRRPCPTSDVEDMEEGILSEGIDFFGQYHPDKIKITLNMCRMRRFATRHGFHFEDVIKIVLIHELGHFVTHRGKATETVACNVLEPNGIYRVATDRVWQQFGSGDASVIENHAQKASNLYLRIAGYGNLPQVFDALFSYCPKQYNSWRDTWREQSKNVDDPLARAKAQFQRELYQSSNRLRVIEEGETHTIGNYDE
jgi:hypothetical protein